MSTPLVNPESHPTLVPDPAAPAMRLAAAPKPPKSPVTALVLALIPPPGLGQVYNGQVAKALVVFFAFCGSVYGCVESNPLPFALFIPFTIFFGAIDAYRTAAQINLRWAGGAVIAEEADESSPVWGISLVVMGLLFLLNNFGLLPLATLHRFWPLLLIAAGVFFLFGSRAGKGQSDPRDAAL